MYANLFPRPLTLFFSLIMATVLTGLWSLLLDGEVLIQSQESQTLEGGPVYNKIRFIPGSEQDVWLMRQSHDGPRHPAHNWDELKLVVHKSPQGTYATYHQYQDGQESEYRASCLQCHANGPRLIRPHQDWKLSLKEKLLLFKWNLRIKTYGKIQNKAHPISFQRIKPLGDQSPKATQTLQVKTCLKCHNSQEGFLTRQPLQKQQSMTIFHLVSTGQMPPWPYQLPPNELQQLRSFLQ